MKRCFVACHNLQKLIISELNQPLAKGKPPGEVTRFELMSPDRLKGVITKLLGQAPESRLVKCQSIPPARTDVVANHFHPVPVQYCPHPLFVLVTCVFGRPL